LLTQRSKKRLFARLWVCTLMILATPTYPAASSRAAFQFASISSLDGMREFVAARFPPGSPRDRLRETFISEANATLIQHPTRVGVEKYIYDIDLCGYYIWRWNISADYDPTGALLQAYVNGEPVFAAGPQKKDSNVLAKSGKAAIFRMKRPRPQAVKGEKELSYLLLDADGDLRTIDDQVLTGSGPSSPNPSQLGRAHAYTNVEPWRSIFDSDAAATIVAFSATCAP
jgi:hypothetical protein